jgi:hypothetical protein
LATSTDGGKLEFRIDSKQKSIIQFRSSLLHYKSDGNIKSTTQNRSKYRRKIKQDTTRQTINQLATWKSSMQQELETTSKVH